MPDDRLDQLLKRELERPPLAAPSPAQARYRQAAAGGGGFQAWTRLGAAFAAGAVTAALVLTIGTGSANPQVWTVRVSSAFTRVTEPAVIPPSPSPSPRPSPSEGPRPSPSGD